MITREFIGVKLTGYAFHVHCCRIVLWVSFLHTGLDLVQWIWL